MDIFAIFTLGGGLAFFLYGMHVMSAGLEKMAGSKLEKMLKLMTSNPFKSFLLGAGITIAIQSSSAMTVMLVGFVNSGIMQLGQTIGIIMGSNVGTTLTAWLLSLTGIESESVWVNLLKPTSFSPVLALIGILMIMVAKSDKKKNVGNILVGFAILMFGMDLMSGAVAPLAEIPEFASVLTMFENPILGVLVGAVFTGIIQSSAASVGILQAFSLTGSLTYGMAIPIIMGQNIGTCMTSFLSSIGTNKNAKRVAAVHIIFNALGTLIWLVVLCAVNLLFDVALLEEAISPFTIAVVHSVFNVSTTVLLFPFARKIEKLACRLVRNREDGQTEEHYELLDDRLLNSPSFAIVECRNKTIEMAVLARDTLLASMDLVKHFDAKAAQLIKDNEDKLDMYEDKLGTFLVKLSSRELSHEDSNEISELLHLIGDFERIGDHAVNILEVAQEIDGKAIRFSEEANQELAVMERALREILTQSTKAFAENNLEIAINIEPLEEVIDGLKDELKNRHIARLQQGKCTIELGFVLTDLLTNYERVSDHCSNVAVCLIQIHDSAFDTHNYLNELKDSKEEHFIHEYEHYFQTYKLP